VLTFFLFISPVHVSARKHEYGAIYRLNRSTI